VTHGEYFVRLPDGRLQTVTYYVDPQSGFRATVAYDRDVPAPAPANTPPARISSPPSNIPASGIIASPVNPLTVRVPSPPVRPVLNAVRSDKSLKALFPSPQVSSSISNNNFVRPVNNVFLQPPVTTRPPEILRTPVQTSVRPEPTKRPRNRFLSQKNRLNNLFQGSIL
jgi:hypothetical protein